MREAIRSGQKSSVLKLMEERGKDRMASSVIQRALKKNDPVMRKVMKRAQYYMGMRGQCAGIGRSRSAR